MQNSSSQRLGAVPMVKPTVILRETTTLFPKLVKASREAAAG